MKFIRWFQQAPAQWWVFYAITGALIALAVIVLFIMC